MKKNTPNDSDSTKVSISETGGRVLRANSPALLVAVAAMVGLIIVMSGVMSFQAQMELASHAGIPHTVAWGWPIIVDGTVIVGTAAVLLLTPRGRGKAAYAWCVLIIFGGVTVAANGVHATGMAVPVLARFGVGAVPAVALLLSAHLFVLMLTSPEIQVEKVIVKKQIVEMEEPVAAEPTAPPLVEPAPQPTMSEAEVESWILAEVAAHGDAPSAADVGEKLGKSRSAGSRFRKAVAERHPQVAEVLGLNVESRAPLQEVLSA